MRTRSLRLRPAATIALLTALAVVVTACTSSKKPATPTTTAGTASPSVSGDPSPSATTIPASIAFSDCTAQFRAAIKAERADHIKFSCGKLDAPLSYASPSGKKTEIYVVKLHDDRQKASERIGSLLVNPGGPGASGVNLAAGLAGSLSDEIFDHFDLVGFDPRGVGLSDPISCISDKQKDQLVALNPDPRTAAGRALAKSTSITVAKQCAAKYGSGLGDFNTEETARDMDLLRRALGDNKLNYLGFSYGTRLGAAYAHLFPTTIRAAVLDGALDPDADDVTVNERQAAGFEQAFDQFAADCLTRSACAVLGNPRTAVTSLIAAADRKPIHSSVQGETRTATGGVVTLAVSAALYSKSEWPSLGDALIAARRGDAAKLFALTDPYNERDPDTGHYSNLLDALTAISCNDSTFVATDTVVAQKAAEWMRKYPIFGRNAANVLYNCAGWPKSGHPLPPAGAVGAPPILVVGTVHDPATPYAATALLAKAVTNGVVLSWDGEGHTAYPQTKCITTKVDSYLVQAKVPSGNSCPAS